MTHEQKPESAEFRTRDAQVEVMATNYMEIGFPLWEARKMATDDVTEAEARGAAEQRRKSEIEDEAENARFADADEESTLNALMRRHGIDREEASEELIWWQERDKRFPLNKAEQRRKDVEGQEPVCFTDQDDLDRVKKGKSGDIYSSPRPEGVYEDYWPIPLYTRPANVAALIAEAVAAERERCASSLAEVAKHLARPWGSHLTEEGIAVKEACVVCVEQEATAIREGGEG